MNLAEPFQQLVERKLWPVALVLAGGAVAAPVLLAGDAPEPVPAPAAVASAAKAQAATQPVVSLTAPGARDVDRKVLGSRKDPFAPVPVKAAKVDKPEVDADAVKSGGADKPSAGGGAAGGGTTSTPVSSPSAPKKVYEVNSLRVRFGETSQDQLPSMNLKRLTSLPDAVNPAVIYLGMLRNGKTAVFLVDASAKVQGDGKCDPTPDNCQTLHLKVGETAFFDVLDDAGNLVKQYQLDFVKVARKKTSSAAAASRARAAEAEGGRLALRARSSRIGRYRYDARSGTLKKLSVKAWKAEASRAWTP